MGRGDRRLFLPQLATAGLSIGCLMTSGPTAAWRHGGVGAGRAPNDVFSSRNRLMSWMLESRRMVVWARDGVESGVALARDDKGYSFIVNGKADGSARGDAGTQVMLGLLGAIRHPQPTRALVIGLGTGSSAGWLAAFRRWRAWTSSSWSPCARRRAGEPAGESGRAQQPNVHIVLGDAREALLTTGARYDVIASEPSNPYRAGIASLFTQESYRAAANRLTDDGVFVQWVQAYDIDARTMRTVYATLQSVFPHVETWQTLGTDIVLSHGGGRSSSRRPRSPRGSNPSRTGRRLSRAGGPRISAASSRTTSATGACTRHLSTPGVEIDTDDRNVVEFGLARAVGRGEGGHVAALRGLAKRLGAAHGLVSNPQTVSWDAVDTAWVGFNGSDGWFFQAPGGCGRGGPSRRDARVFPEERPGGRERLWPAGVAPRDIVELAMLADLRAGLAAPDAETLIEQLRTVPADGGRHPSGKAAGLSRAARRGDGSPRWGGRAAAHQSLAAAPPQGAGARAPRTRGVNQRHSKREAPAGDRAAVCTRGNGGVAPEGGGVDGASSGRHPGMPRAGRSADPHTPWNAAYLSLRRDCYRRAGDSRVLEAERDLARFLAAETLPLGATPQDDATAR